MTTSIGSDRELLADHLAGVTGAFDELFRRYRDRLWAVAFRILGDRTDAEDAVQEAFLSALRTRSYRGDAEVGTWLHRILVNKCMNRMHRARLHLVAEARPLEAPGRGPDLSSAVTSRLALDGALALLAPEQRAAVVLVDALGYPVAEAAAILEVPPGTVKSRSARGRARLVELLADTREGRR
ncbi:MAG: RNA polymerase sigma factor SigM [Pseudonocardia sp.]|nr:RNA polymerase sigma factor SigM [Pseudonocardia sp.]